MEQSIESYKALNSQIEKLIGDKIKFVLSDGYFVGTFEGSSFSTIKPEAKVLVKGIDAFNYERKEIDFRDIVSVEAYIP